VKISQLSLGRTFATLVSEEYKRQTGKNRKVTGLQLGYEGALRPGRMRSM